MSFTVAVVGGTGRLGQVIRRVVESMPEATLLASLGSGDPIETALAADVVVDATHPAASPAIVERVIASGRRALIGTSGWSEERITGLRRHVAEHPGTGAVVIPNFSLGAALASGFAAIAARYFDSAEVIEVHHAGKVDSPSGTAVRTAEMMAAARHDLGPFASPHTDQRARGQQVASIPIHSLRMAGVVARQDVVFGGAGETLTIAHDTVSTAAYEAGIRVALERAARTTDEVVVGLDTVLGLGWIVSRAPDATAADEGPDGAG